MSFLISSKIQDSVFEALCSGETKQYLFENFGAPGFVQQGIDNDEYPNPENEEFPSIVIYNPVKIEKSQQENSMKFSVLIALAIQSNENEIEYIAPQVGDTWQESVQGSKIFLAAKKIEDFREKVEEILYSENTREILQTILGQRGIAISTTSDTLSDSDFPIFRSNLILNLNIKINRNNPLRTN